MCLSKLQEIVKDGETWHGAVHGVAKSWTWLSDWTMATIIRKNCTFLILAPPQLGTVTPIDEETKSEESCITCPMLCKRFELWSPSPCSACGVTLDGRQSPGPGHMALPGHAGTGGVPHSLQGTSVNVITANFWNRCKKELNPTTGLTSSDSCGQVSAEAGPWF